MQTYFYSRGKSSIACDCHTFMVSTYVFISYFTIRNDKRNNIGRKISCNFLRTNTIKVIPLYFTFVTVSDETVQSEV